MQKRTTKCSKRKGNALGSTTDKKSCIQIGKLRYSKRRNAINSLRQDEISTAQLCPPNREEDGKTPTLPYLIIKLER